MNTPTTITIPEAARRTGLHHQTIRRWLRNGTLTEYRTGGGRGRPVVAVDELDAVTTPRRAEEVDA